MIANKHEYRRIQTMAAELAASLAKLYTQPSRQSTGFDPVVRGGLMSQLLEREAELAEYEARLGGPNRVQAVETLAELPALLIEARRARGWSPQDLADRVGLTKDQIVQAELSHYAAVPLAQIQAIGAALSLVVRASVAMPPSNWSELDSHPEPTALNQAPEASPR